MSQHAPSPSLFFQTVNAYQRTAAIKSALELEVFTAVGEGLETAPELAGRCKASEKGLRILCDYLVLLGFLTKQDGRYGLTTDSALFLDRRSPGYAGGVTEFLLSSQITDSYIDLTQAVRKGGTAMPSEGTLSAEHPVWVRFARAMGPAMAMPAELLPGVVGAPTDRKMRVLDIAAGHGMFGIAFAKHNPQCEVTATDWPNVLAVASENARAAGVDQRFHLIPGSAFDVDFGSGYDLVLLPNFLHHFDPPTCERLLAKVHAALVEGGKAVAVEFIPDESRVTPPDAAAFAMQMLATTPAGDAYTFVEYETMFRGAGSTQRVAPVAADDAASGDCVLVAMECEGAGQSMTPNLTFFIGILVQVTLAVLQVSVLVMFVYRWQRNSWRYGNLMKIREPLARAYCSLAAVARAETG